jgi:hypothetical protein
MDVDLQGVTVRFLDAHPREVRLVERQLPGVMPSPAAAPPDLVVSFVDTLAMHGQVRRIGDDLVDDKGVILVRPGHGRVARVRVPLGGGHDDGVVVCERHVRVVPLLFPLVLEAALGKGLLPLHAVAFTHRGVGVAATGWPGSGKTAVLLAMLAAGAQPVAAEWVLVSQDGHQLLGMPQALRLKPSHVDRWPELSSLSRAAGGPRRRALSALRPVAARIAPSTKPFVERALQVDVPLHRLKLGASAASAATGRLSAAPFDVLVLLEDAEVGEPTVERVEATFAAERIAAGLDHDFAELHAARRLFHYASARSGNDSVGATDAAHRQLLARHLPFRPIFLLRHRQPTAFETLRAAVERAIA